MKHLLLFPVFFFCLLPAPTAQALFKQGDFFYANAGIKHKAPMMELGLISNDLSYFGMELNMQFCELPHSKKLGYQAEIMLGYPLATKGKNQFFVFPQALIGIITVEENTKTGDYSTAERISPPHFGGILRTGVKIDRCQLSLIAKAQFFQHELEEDYEKHKATHANFLGKFEIIYDLSRRFQMVCGAGYEHLKLNHHVKQHSSGFVATVGLIMKIFNDW